MERGNPVKLLLFAMQGKDSDPRGLPMALQEQEVGKSEC